MNKQIVLAIVRHTLTFLGGVLIAKGTIDAETANELTGAALTLIGGIWSVLDKKPKA